MASAGGSNDGTESEGKRKLCDLCDSCKNGEHKRNQILLCTKRETLGDKKKNGWKSELLEFVSAAANSERTRREPWWKLKIHVKDAENYPEAHAAHAYFSMKLMDRLNILLFQTTFSDALKLNLEKESNKYFLLLEIRLRTKVPITVNFNSLESSDLGRFPLTYERFFHLMYGKREPGDDPGAGTEHFIPKRDVALKEPLENLQLVNMHESKNVQMKASEHGENVSKVKKLIKNTVRDYVSAFAKCAKGGHYYCGLAEVKVAENEGAEDEGAEDEGAENEGAENREPMMKELQIRIQPATLDDEGKTRIHSSIVCSITSGMKWLARDNTKIGGFSVLSPQSVKEGEHFYITFLPVKSQTGGGENPQTEGNPQTGGAGKPQTEGGGKGNPQGEKMKKLYIIEVTAAPFDGVVFVGQGPDSYKFARKKGTCKLERMELEVWAKKMSTYAWCDKHNTNKQPKCSECTREKL